MELGKPAPRAEPLPAPNSAVSPFFTNNEALETNNLSVSPVLTAAAAIREAARKKKQREQRRQEFIRDNGIYLDALALGRRYYEATGSQLDRSGFIALRHHGYFSHNPDEVERVFLDWDNYQADVLQDYQKHAAETQDERAELMQVIELDRQIGAVPDVLFKQAAPACSVDREKQGSYTRTFRRANLRIPFEAEVDDDEKIRRYCMYKIVEALTPNLDNEERTAGQRELLNPSERRANMVLGYNAADSGKLLSSTAAELEKSNSSELDVATANKLIEEVARERGWLKYLRPDEYKTEQARLVKAAEANHADWLDNRTSFPAELLSYDPEEIYYNKIAGKLVLGRLAIKAALARQAQSRVSNVTPLSEILINYKVKTSRADKARFKEWGQHDCIKYGQFLLKLTGTINCDLIEQASRLGIGPGIKGIQVRFDDSLINFYHALGVESKNKAGSFDQWTLENMIDYVKSVANQHDGKISKNILTEHHWQMKKQGIKVPSPSTIVRVCDMKIGEVIEAAGFKIKHRKKSLQSCVYGAVRFYRDHGRFPVVADLSETDYLHAWPTIRRYCGSIGNLHRLAAEVIANEDVDGAQDVLAA